jgi:hypothetical protein
MSPIVVVALVISSAGVMLLPRRWAALPLIIGGCYMSRDRGLDIGPFTFTVLRLLIMVAAARVTLRREWLFELEGSLDTLVVLWGVWMVVSVAFHDNAPAAIVYRLRLAFEGVGLFFLFRSFFRSRDELYQMPVIVAVALAPLAIAMVAEKVTAHDLFSVFGGVPESAVVRNGTVRAQGPFGSPILAGTVGAVSFPLMFALWSKSRVLAVSAMSVCLAIVLASASSGPILTASASVVALAFWSWRRQMRWVRRGLFWGYIALDAVMKAPAYYLMARIDLTGSSSSYHRARLIEEAIAHLNEWWLIGTDYTRHWMPTGLEIDPNNTDITNHYLGMGVAGGLPLMLIFIAMLVKGFSSIGVGLREETSQDQKFLVWAIGAALFAHTVTCISVSYFDQSIVFFYLTLAAARVTRTAAVMPRSQDIIAIRQRTRPSSRSYEPFGSGSVPRGATTGRFATSLGRKFH